MGLSLGPRAQREAGSAKRGFDGQPRRREACASHMIGQRASELRHRRVCAPGETRAYRFYTVAYRTCDALRDRKKPARFRIDDFVCFSRSARASVAAKAREVSDPDEIGRPPVHELDEIGGRAHA